MTTNNNIDIATIRSEVMQMAHKIRKAKGLSLSEALKIAWAEVKEQYNYTTNNQKTIVVVEKTKEPSEALAEIEPKDLTTLEKIEKYEELKQIVEAINDKMTQLKTSLIEDMNGEQKLKVGIFEVRYIDVTSNRLDVKKLQKEQEDIYKKYLAQSKTKRFSIVC